MCVLQTCVTLHQERCVRSSIKSGEYPEKAEFLPESRLKSGSNYAEAKYFGKSQVAGVINRGSPMMRQLEMRLPLTCQRHPIPNPKSSRIAPQEFPWIK